MNLIQDMHPPPHAKYVVKRDGFIFTATPCYGMHHPWWVVSTMASNAAPLAMEKTDEWLPISEVRDLLLLDHAKKRNKKMICMFEGNDEILLFAVNNEGEPVGDEAYFKKEDGTGDGDRDREDYDRSLIELPMQINSKGIRAEPDRVLTG